MSDLKADLYIGLMSGTSIDAIDSALVSIEDGKTSLLHSREHAIPSDTRDQVSSISHKGDDEIERMGRLDRTLGRLFADATLELLASADLASDAVTAIGSHGQTIRHRPPSAGTRENSYTLQIGDPNTIAEITGITTVADFRRRDIAAGGEGAPLAPAFHASAFSRAGFNRAIVNIGGIANASLLEGEGLIAGFDTGPGNTLLDAWISRHTGQRYDQDGAWAAGGSVNMALLDTLMSHPYLSLSGPRSTGKEAFNLTWLDTVLVEHPRLAPQDIQATLSQFTARSIASAIHKSELKTAEVYICGGGAHNRDLMERLSQELPAEIQLESSSALGISPDWVEAATFAWLAHRTLAGLAGNATVVTGAGGERVLGAIFPGGRP